MILQDNGEVMSDSEDNYDDILELKEAGDGENVKYALGDLLVTRLYKWLVIPFGLIMHLRCYAINEYVLHAFIDCFLRYVVSTKEIEVDEEKIKAIKEWLTPKNITEIKSIHDLASFYRRFYKQDKENVVANAWSRKYVLLISLGAKLLGFEYVKDMYATNSKLSNKYESCNKCAVDRFFRRDGYLFWENKLNVPKCLMRELLVCEAYNGGLLSHFGVKKTLEVLDASLVKKAKSKVLPQGLYLTSSGEP
ncbi:uncharacterized protein LOC111400538 [Olea europaea var. sylvestris]|uniref:uncharacterized protein LOC111400538 n=1 Tax=Olea europaea var. sylvestris TaxID=158386 RepID=UPI000C1CF94E|nr:uncharacterized protein LOC111400538 [Olea europaea var. sylvestris]